MRLKIFVLFQMVIITIAVIIGQMGKAKMDNCGILDVRNLDQLYQLDVTVYSYFIDEDYDGFKEYKNDYINDQNAASIIAIVKPTGNIRPFHLALCNEVKVEQVIQGDKQIEGKIIPLYETVKFLANEDMKNRLEYRDIQNLMQTDHTYLAFFSPLELNQYTREDSYRMADTFFDYLDLGPDQSIPLDPEPEQMDFKSIKNIEYFATSQRTLDVLLEIKHSVIDMYLPNGYTQ